MNVWYLFAVGVDKHGVVPVLLVELTHEIMVEYCLAFTSVPQYWGVGGGGKSKTRAPWTELEKIPLDEQNVRPEWSLDQTARQMPCKIQGLIYLSLAKRPIRMLLSHWTCKSFLICLIAFPKLSPFWQGSILDDCLQFHVFSIIHVANLVLTLVCGNMPVFPAMNWRQIYFILKKSLYHNDMLATKLFWDQLFLKRHPLQV